jgi:hypothetical protein
LKPHQNQLQKQQIHSITHTWHNRLHLIDQPRAPIRARSFLHRGSNEYKCKFLFTQNSTFFRNEQFTMPNNIHVRYFSTTTSKKSDNKDEASNSEWTAMDVTPLSPHEPPPISKVLSILLPEVKWLSVAVGALTLATGATMQFPNAIGMMVRIDGWYFFPSQPNDCKMLTITSW